MELIMSEKTISRRLMLKSTSIATASTLVTSNALGSKNSNDQHGAINIINNSKTNGRIIIKIKENNVGFRKEYYTEGMNSESNKTNPSEERAKKAHNKSSAPSAKMPGIYTIEAKYKSEKIEHKIPLRENGFFEDLYLDVIVDTEGKLKAETYYSCKA